MRSQFDDIAKSAVSVGGVQVVSQRVAGVDDKQLRDVSDRLRDGAGIGVVVLSSVSEDKVSFVVSVQKALTERGIHAGHLAKSRWHQSRGRAAGAPISRRAAVKMWAHWIPRLKKSKGIYQGTTKEMNILSARGETDIIFPSEGKVSSSSLDERTTLKDKK